MKKIVGSSENYNATHANNFDDWRKVVGLKTIIKPITQKRGKNKKICS